MIEPGVLSAVVTPGTGDEHWGRAGDAAGAGGP